MAAALCHSPPRYGFVFSLLREYDAPSPAFAPVLDACAGSTGDGRRSPPVCVEELGAASLGGVLASVGAVVALGALVLPGDADGSPFCGPCVQPAAHNESASR
jgi:hypothetical protein